MPIFTQFTPNLQTKEVLKSFFYLTPFGWPFLSRGLSSKKLQLEIESYFDKKVSLFDSGRSALYSILNTLPKTKVLVQGYTCVVVINAILKAGHTPVYVDTMPDSFNMSLDDLKTKISPDTKALIVQHTYGNPDQIDKISKLAKQNGIFLIEDLAHSLTATHFGKKVGTFGNAAFLSFGTGKIISSSRGGALIADEYQNQYKYPNPFSTLRHHYKHVLFAFCKPIYFVASIGKAKLFLARKLRLIPDIISKAEKRLQIDQIKVNKLPNSLASIALTQWRKKDFFKNHRQTIASIYDRHLSNLPQVKIYTSQDSAQMMYPIQAENPDELFFFLKGKQIILDQFWAKSIIAPKGIDINSTKYAPNTCPNAEKQLNNELNLPTHIHISPQKADRICKLIKDFYDTRS